MKKIFLFLFALAATVAVNAQTTVTFQVNVTKLIAGGTPIAGAGMRIAGTFASVGASATGVPMVNWGPNDTTGKMTDMGNNIWAVSVTFPSDTIAKGTDTLFFKFVDGTWYAAGANEDGAPGDDSLILGGCAYSTGNNHDNRILPLTSLGSTYQWCYDHCVQCDGSPALVTTGIANINNVSVFNLAPNPAVNKQSILMYSVTEYSPVNISLYNVLGQSVKTFVNTNRPSGIYNQPINLNGLSAGVYFIQLTSGSQTIAKKVVVE